MPLANHENCTGCMACRNICPAKAILPETDACGFLVPVIREDLCVGCGLCEKVCPVLKEKKEAVYPMKAWSVFHRDPAVVRRSSSGGAFYALASKVLKRGGIVFGSYFDVREKEARLTDTDHLPLDALLTSKYVESYVGEGFQEAERQLKAGRPVLFCGTPCQAAGLKSFLGRDYDNLLLVDFVCGAVTARKYLKDYLQSLEKRFGSRITKMTFRDKHYGWGQYCFYAEFENGKIYRKTAMSDPYFFCFLRSSMQRLSCHGCQFSDHHVSDLCLGDFWRCDAFEGGDGNDRKGLSLVQVFTAKGEEAVKELEDTAVLKELDREKAAYNIQARSLLRSKLPEILSHQETAAGKGVAVLRRQLLSPRQRARYALRQFVMDHPFLEKYFPGLKGKGQIQ